MRGYWASALVFLLLGAGVPSCGPSLDDTCDASGFTGRQVLNDTPSPMSGTLFYTEGGTTTYTMTVRYDGGGVSCTASKTVHGCLGPTTLPANTTVQVLVSLDTNDGKLAVHDGHGTLSKGTNVPLSLDATWNIPRTVRDGICASGSNLQLELKGMPISSSATFQGDLMLSCDVPNGIESGSVGTFE